jgi:hypothetical protein
MSHNTWSIEPGRFREKFVVSTDKFIKVYFDVHSSAGDNSTNISHFWLDPSVARELALALNSAADIAERNKNK